MALHPEAIAELEAASGARQLKAATSSAHSRINAIEAKTDRIESTLANIGGGVSWEDLPEVILDAFKAYNEQAINPLKDRIAKLEAALAVKAPVKYLGTFKLGRIYSEGSLCTYDGSLWHANKSTSEPPGNGHADWQLCVKHGERGRDGKDSTK